METFTVLPALCAGNSPVTGEFPAQRPVTRSFDALFDLRLNKRLSKQSWGWWFDTPSGSLWRHCNVCILFCATRQISKKQYAIKINLCDRTVTEFNRHWQEMSCIIEWGNTWPVHIAWDIVYTGVLRTVVILLLRVSVKRVSTISSLHLDYDIEAETQFENVVCEMAVILSRRRWVKRIRQHWVNSLDKELVMRRTLTRLSTHELECKLHSCIDNISNWYDMNKLCMNKEKSSVLVIERKKLLRSLNFDDLLSL